MTTYSVQIGSWQRTWNEQALLNTLQSLGRANRNSRIRYDLTVIPNPGLLNRIFWAVIAGHFHFLRYNIYRVDFERTRTILLQLQPQIARNTVIYQEYATAIANFRNLHDAYKIIDDGQGGFIRPPPVVVQQQPSRPFISFSPVKSVRTFFSSNQGTRHHSHPSVPAVVNASNHHGHHAPTLGGHHAPVAVAVVNSTTNTIPVPPPYIPPPPSVRQPRPTAPTSTTHSAPPPGRTATKPSNPARTIPMARPGMPNDPNRG